MLDLRHDPRWMRLNDPLFTTPAFAGGDFGLDIDRPAAWAGGEPVSGDEDFDPNNVLSADFCIIEDKRFFIRGVVELPILGGGGKTLGYAIWTEVSRASFGAYLKAFDNAQPVPPPIPATFANELPGFAPTLGQPCSVRIRLGAERPLVTFNDTAHDVARDQLRGITLDRMLDLYAAAGADLRPALGVTH